MASRARNRRRFKSSTSRLTMQKLRHQACCDADFVRSALAEAAARRAESQPHVAEQLAAARAPLKGISRNCVKHQPNTFCRASAEVAQRKISGRRVLGSRKTTN